MHIKHSLGETTKQKLLYDCEESILQKDRIASFTNFGQRDPWNQNLGN